MLKLLRQKGLQKKIYMGLAVAVILTFLVSGVLITQDDAKTMTALAKLGNRKISVNEYLNNYRAVQRQAGWMYGDKLNEMRSRLNFKSEAWDRLLLLEEAKKEEVRVPDSEVIAWIAKQESFKKDGKFDDSYYRMFVERGLRSTPRQFEEEIRQMLTIGKLQENAAAGIDLSDANLKELYRQQRTEKDLLIGTLESKTLEEQVAVTDEDIKLTYETVKDNLTAPEKAQLSYVTVPKDSEEKFKAAFDDTETPFKDLAAKYALTVKETAFFSKNEAVPELTDWPEALNFAFTASEGETSGWFSNEKGRARAALTGKQAEHPMSLDEAKEEVKKLFRQDEARKLSLEKMKKIREKITGPADFETVLKAEGITPTPQEKYRKGMYPSGVWPSENLQQAVEKLEKDGISDAFDVPKGAMVVMMTAEHGFDEKKFEEEKENFKEQIKSERTGEKMNETLERLRDKLSLNLELMKELFPADAA